MSSTQPTSPLAESAHTLINFSSDHQDNLLNLLKISRGELQPQMISKCSGIDKARVELGPLDLALQAHEDTLITYQVYSGGATTLVTR